MAATAMGFGAIRMQLPGRMWLASCHPLASLACLLFGLLAIRCDGSRVSKRSRELVARVAIMDTDASTRATRSVPRTQFGSVSSLSCGQPWRCGLDFEDQGQYGHTGTLVPPKVTSDASRHPPILPTEPTLGPSVPHRADLQPCLSWVITMPPRLAIATACPRAQALSQGTIGVGQDGE